MYTCCKVGSFLWGLSLLFLQWWFLGLKPGSSPNIELKRVTFKGIVLSVFFLSDNPIYVDCIDWLISLFSGQLSHHCRCIFFLLLSKLSLDQTLSCQANCCSLWFACPPYFWQLGSDIWLLGCQDSIMITALNKFICITVSPTRVQSLLKFT